MYPERCLKDFLKDVASRTPAPGGGSVAALSGALSAAILSMVANYTLGKEKFKSVEPQVKRILIELEEHLRNFAELIQEDIEAYGKFSGASRMPKKTVEEQRRRAESMEQALREAAEVPLRAVLSCFKVIQIAEDLLSIGNPNLISDVGVGVIMAQAALESAALNVEINLKYIRNTAFKNKKREKLAGILPQGIRAKREILEEVKRRITSSS